MKNNVVGSRKMTVNSFSRIALKPRKILFIVGLKVILLPPLVEEELTGESACVTRLV
jgi:hypothetical protein